MSVSRTPTVLVYLKIVPQIDLGRSLINIKSDLINSGLLTSTNNKLVTTQNILFSVPTFTVPANYKIIETPARPEYLHITTSTISEINLRIVDEKRQTL